MNASEVRPAGPAESEPQSGVPTAALSVPGDIAVGYLVLGAVIAGAAVLLTAVVRERRRPKAEPVPPGRRSAAFTDTLRSADFRWVFIGRFPQILAPFLAALLVGAIGYDGPYVTAALITLLGAAAVIPVTSVR
ncbi:hypothetical protein GCM10010275_17090 [Streptomyces litmocidini]|uniref:hypothetical protein n=1 Tax=Streptomyces litmocidini TaxID=67318 RepID=UPI00167C7D48|nr:hypothetical protein [Streptomyces litmocidini]GGU82554.1 hypothetical protein GCM10010275_17090 [Streptomyces litmocidini]